MWTGLRPSTVLEHALGRWPLASDSPSAPAPARTLRLGRAQQHLGQCGARGGDHQVAAEMQWKWEGHGSTCVSSACRRIHQLDGCHTVDRTVAVAIPGSQGLLACSLHSTPGTHPLGTAAASSSPITVTGLIWSDKRLAKG